jgi:dynein heavy chain
LARVSLLTANHLREVKALPKPPEAVVITISAVTILLSDYIRKTLGKEIEKVKEGDKWKDDYFKTARLYLLDDPKGLLVVINSYDKDNINPRFIAKIDEVCKPSVKFNQKDAEQGS